MGGRRIGIVGGGIGGLTAALALRDAGDDPVVYEAAGDLRAVGAGIWMPINAMRVFHRLGVGEAVEASGMPVDRLEVRSPRNDLLKAVELEPFRVSYGCGTVAIHRGRLQEVLAAAVGTDRIRTGHACVDVEAPVQRAGHGHGDGEAVRLRFRGGGDVDVEGALGADGIRSVVREHVAPGIRPRHTGQVAVRGICRQAIPEERGGASTEYWGAGLRFGLVAIAPEETYWWCAYDVDGPWGGVPSLARIRTLAGSFPGVVASVVEGTDPEDLIVTPLADLPPVPRWFRGRVALLGDAAHAMTPNLGQGGAQAIEDAWVLSRILARYASPGPEAFSAYEKARRTRAGSVARASWWTGKLAHVANPVGRWMRDSLLRATPGWVDRRQARALYGTPAVADGV